NPPTFRSRRRIGPIFWHRWRQMPAVLAKVETGLCLDKILDIDKAEMGPVIKKLVVFVVAVGRNGCLRRHAIGSSADLLEKIAEPHIDSGRRHLEFLEAIQKTVDLHIYGVRVPSADAGAVNVSDVPPCRFTLRQEDIRTAIALDLFSTNLRLQWKVEFWVITERLRQDELATSAGREIPQRFHDVIGQFSTAAVLEFSMNI